MNLQTCQNSGILPNCSLDLVPQHTRTHIHALHAGLGLALQHQASVLLPLLQYIRRGVNNGHTQQLKIEMKTQQHEEFKRSEGRVKQLLVICLLCVKPSLCVAQYFRSN